MVTVSGQVKSFSIASRILSLFDLTISPRHLNELTIEIGEELRQQRDAQTHAYQHRPLNQPHRSVEPNPPLACVQVDGGRMQTRTPDSGKGVHAPHWRESKTAGFFRMTTRSYDEDPCPELPSSYRDSQHMSQLLGGLSEVPNREQPQKPDDWSWRPKSQFRTGIASLCDSESFGPMMAAEAESRGFFRAKKRAFLGDGLKYNWSIQKKWFSSFTPILDLTHVIEHLHKGARAVFDSQELAWEQTGEWLAECWAGNVEEVIGILKSKQVVLGEPPPDAEDTDRRKILAETIGYFENNQERMKYPEYRKAGLPTSSCLIESLIKEINHRVKGSEKFWNDGTRGEAILQIRAALLSDNNRLKKYFQNRPGSPFARKSRKSQTSPT